MHSIVTDKMGHIARLCAKYHVARLELFGSAALANSAETNPGDLDFLVELSPSTPEEHSERYFGLMEELETLFGSRVDLVEAKAMNNPYFIRRVNESRKLIYAA
jgi:hypothetical protein